MRSEKLRTPNGEFYIFSRLTTKKPSEQKKMCKMLKHSKELRITNEDN